MTEAGQKPQRQIAKLDKGEIGFQLFLLGISVVWVCQAYPLVDWRLWSASGTTPFVVSCVLLLSCLYTLGKTWLARYLTGKPAHLRLNSGQPENPEFRNPEVRNQASNLAINQIQTGKIQIIQINKASVGRSHESLFSRVMGLMLILTVLLLVALPYLGFLLATWLFLGVAMGALQKPRRWASPLVIGGLVTLAIYVLFRLFFQVALPEGNLLPEGKILAWLAAWF